MASTGEVVNNHRRKFLLLLLIIVVILGLIGTYYYIYYKSTHISTDDAFVAGRIHVIAAKVPGTVKSLMVKDNQYVKKDDLLVEIDEKDYDVRVREAESTVGTEQSKLLELTLKVDVTKKQYQEALHRLESAKAGLRLQEVQLKQAELDLKRAETLLRKEIISTDRYDKAKTAYDTAVAQVDAAREQLKQAEASMETQKSMIRQSESARQSQGSTVKQRQETLNAETLKKSYTKIYAPADGYVTKKSIEVGNQIQVGQPLLAVVPLDDVWVVANYKETQLAKVKLGQNVRVEVDSYHGKAFSGKVQSIMAGTGSAFSLFPPENATGNYVKIVQRIPVKIVLEKGSDPDHILRVGMSVEPTILVDE
jgi:membrane fusion protein, multidrug efflux system